MLYALCIMFEGPGHFGGPGMVSETIKVAPGGSRKEPWDGPWELGRALGWSEEAMSALSLRFPMFLGPRTL